MRASPTVALAEAIGDQLGIDLTPAFVEQVDLVLYRLFLRGFVVRPLKEGRSAPPPSFVFPPHMSGKPGAVSPSAG